MSTGVTAVITEAGISAPPFATVLATLQDRVRTIYGSDIYIEPDSKDGQLIVLFAQAVSDCNDVAVAVKGQFAPGSAIGTGLSSVVKVNGIERLEASYSSAPGSAIGQAGTVIMNGAVKDENGNLWNLPESVTIPPGGEILVTVTAQELGDISAPAGSIDAIATPALGWQSFTSTADATPGAPVERDPTLRQRQTVSTSLPALTVLGALEGALLNLPGVQRVRIYDNDDDAPDANGVPGHTECVVIEGGDLAQIALTIGQKKTPGGGTYGTTSQVYVDPVTGIVYTINFYILALTTIKVRITGTALPGYTTTIGDDIKVSMVDYLESHTIGERVEYTGLWGPAYLDLPARLQPYRVDTLEVSTDGGATWNELDVAIDFNKVVNCTLADVTVTIT